MNAQRSRHGTRSLILESALELLCASGFSGITLGSLAKRVGMSKSGLFAHFKSIEQVHLAVAVYAYELFQENVVTPALGLDKGLSQLRETVSRWLEWTSRSCPPGGTPLVAAFFEFDDKDGPIRAVLLHQEVHWRGQLTRIVQETITCGSFREDLDVPQFVSALCGISYSFHVSLRFLREASSSQVAGRLVDAIIASAMKRSKGN
jgi:AcrR family transcriptional regulator